MRRTSMSSGYAEQDSRANGTVRTFSVSWSFSSDEFALFEDWFADDLKGGVLTFALDFDFDGTGETPKPFRFVGGTYKADLDGGLHYNVTAVIECLVVIEALTNTVLAVPPWMRLSVDPAGSQVLTFSHRNAILTTRPTAGNTTTLQIYPPDVQNEELFFGINHLGDGDVLVTSDGVDPIEPDATPLFPAGLPQVNLGFQDDGSRQVSRFDTDGGFPRQWSGADYTRKTYSGNWTFTLAELEAFETFFFTTLRAGTRFFRCTLPVDNDFDEVLVRFQGGTFTQTELPGNLFKVEAVMERKITQAETPGHRRPYALFYSPEVEITGNTVLTADDDGKMFVCEPGVGETFRLEVKDLDLEFGLLNRGEGDVLITRTTLISGTAYPGETLTASQADQWYVNDVAVDGETGSTYVVGIDDIGYEIRQSNSNVLTCWSPADISGVHSFWTPYRNVYHTTSPLALAAPGETIARWTDIKAGHNLEPWDGSPTYNNVGGTPYSNTSSTQSLRFTDRTVFRNKAYGAILVANNLTAATVSSSSHSITYLTDSTSGYRLAIRTTNTSYSDQLGAITSPVSTNFTINTTDASVGSAMVQTVIANWNNGTMLLRKNGSQIGSTTFTATMSEDVLANGTVCGYVGRGVTGFTYGKHYAVCLVNAALTATERSQLERYLGMFVGVDIPLE